LRGERQTPCYVGFALAPGKEPVRVELGPAAPIDVAVKEWRQAVAAWQPGLPAAEARKLQAKADALGARLRQLVWEPLARPLPPGTRTVYLAPDGDLARLPFAALPGSQLGKVLLEEVAIAFVPHGPFLLERLQQRPPSFEGPAPVLALGGVRYNLAEGAPTGRGYPFLEGTVAELKQLQALAGPTRPVTVLRDTSATAGRLRAELPRARYAHLATHGFFDDAALTAEKKRGADQLERVRQSYQFQEGQTTGRVGLGARSPLSYTGLVLAGANQPDQAGPERGIVTSDALLALPLENLRMVVLSACETGLGDLTGGEGVQGLQRAFHLAGCADVIASLWNVNDAATAALMAAFYHGLWVENKSPLEALRAAQLLVYRRPDLIPHLAGDRGEVRRREVLARPGPEQSPGRAPTKLWAAFVFAGTGQP
jgi:CHAT domain-containing protein